MQSVTSAGQRGTCIQLPVDHQLEQNRMALSLNGSCNHKVRRMTSSQDSPAVSQSLLSVTSTQANPRFLDRSRGARLCLCLALSGISYKCLKSSRAVSISAGSCTVHSQTHQSHLSDRHIQTFPDTFSHTYVSSRQIPPPYPQAAARHTVKHISQTAHSQTTLFRYVRQLSQCMYRVVKCRLHVRRQLHVAQSDSLGRLVRHNKSDFSDRLSLTWQEELFEFVVQTTASNKKTIRKFAPAHPRT